MRTFELSAPKPWSWFIIMPIAAAIHDVYRDGPEAALPHLEGALDWRLAFEARRQAV
jgi:hypothetical protein